MEKISLKAMIAIIVVLFIISFILINPKGHEKQQSNNGFQKKLGFIVEDAKVKFKDATDVEIINVMRLNKSCDSCVNAEGEYLVTLKVVYYENKSGLICPKRYHIHYLYPNRGFANMPPELIIGDCDLCKKGKRCSITMKEEAIIAAYNKDDSIKEFVKEENAFPYVYGDDGGKNWTVVWKGRDAELKIVIDDKARILNKSISGLN